MADWKTIRAEYIASDISYRKLAEKSGVSFNTLKTRATEEQWYKLRQQKDHKTTTKIVETLSDKDAKKAVDIIDVADKLLDKITEYIETIPLSAQAVKQLTSAIKDIKEIKGIKSKADEREQEARIKNLEKMAEKGQQDDNGTGILILPSISDMSTPPREDE